MWLIFLAVLCISCVCVSDPLLKNVLDTGVDVELFLTEAICSYILFLNGLPVSPTYTFEHLVQDIWYIISSSSYVICLGKFLVKVHMVSFIFVIRGQQVHFPNLVQILGVI